MSVCKDCVYWHRQNSVMGRCKYPLPDSVREMVGKGVMKGGVYQWVDAVKACVAFEKANGEGSR